MRREKPIHRAITEVLRAAGTALTAEEIYARIRESDLYAFKAKDPLHVVVTDLRRHCIGLNFPSARRTKYFERVGESDSGRYRLLPRPVQVEPNVYRVKRPGARGEAIVTVAPEDGDMRGEQGSVDTVHTDMQYRLLELGTSLGFATWAPKPDRNKRIKGRSVRDVPGLLDSLPRQFDEATMKVISYIDVIWLKGSSIMAAFEIEHTTPVYSGLLRMADLLCMQPNLRIDWYLVAPAMRFEKFAREVSRPTFSNLGTPLHQCCRFLAYEKLVERLQLAKAFFPHLKPGFLCDIAELYDPREAFEE